MIVDPSQCEVCRNDNELPPARMCKRHLLLMLQGVAIAAIVLLYLGYLIGRVVH